MITQAKEALPCLSFRIANEIGLEEIENFFLKTLKKMGDDDVKKLAQQKLQEWDTDNDGRVTLADFAEYVLRAIATEKDPWEFLDE